MPDPDRRPVPASAGSTPLDRAAVERVLARAAELHASNAEGSEPGALTEAQLLEIAREAGLSPDHVRRAIAEERTRIALPEEHGLAARVAGPGTAAAARVVPGSRAQVAAALDRWLDREACLRVLRRYGERTVWEPRRDVIGNLRRGFTGGDAGALRGVTALAVTTVDAGDGRTFVRLDADVHRGRRQRLAVGGVAAGGGAMAGAALFGVGVVAHAALLVLAPIAAVPVLAGAGAGWALARGHRAAVERVQTVLEHLLDQLEHGELPGARATPLLDVLQEVRRALR